MKKKQPFSTEVKEVAFIIQNIKLIIKVYDFTTMSGNNRSGCLQRHFLGQESNRTIRKSCIRSARMKNKDFIIIAGIHDKYQLFYLR